MRVRTYAGWPMTPIVKRILIINVVVWVFEIISVNWFDTNLLVDHLALTPLRVFPGFEVWQPLTYMWLHSPGDLMHILFNMLFLWMFGGNLELSWGSRAFLEFYLKCGVGAGLIVLVSGMLFAPGVPVLGASGALFGLIVAWAISFPNKEIYFFGIFPMKGKHFVLIPIGFAVFDFLTKASGVSHAAHLGGMAIGALLITGFWRPNKAYRQLKYWWLRRKLTVLQGGGDSKTPPPDGGYWH
jgi:rhomboid family protein